ncbi:hypothetical protein [Polaribacter sp. R77954]|uniref:hypothetical protein n=1 Tax=Polaribacter sp. R77954 TaxID=3093870 RepID=UPI0037C9B320
MNTALKKSVLATAIVLTTGLFINCNQKKITTNDDFKEEITENTVAFSFNEAINLRKPVVFITGIDQGNETFYHNSRLFFKDHNYQVIEDQYSLEEIINWLNHNESEKPYGEIHIVNKSNAFKGLTLETVINGEKVTTESLRKHITKGTLPILQESINANSKIIFHANGLGDNKELLNTFKDALCADELPSIVASPYYSVFDGAFTQHYLAKPYYIFYPTANSPGKVDLSKEIAKKYPEEKDINWLDALQNYEERFIGEPYTKQFTIPLKFKLDYHNSDEEVPNFENQDEIIDFIEQQEVLFFEVEQLKIPIEKYRWSYSMHNSTLTIKGKATVLVVLKPLIKPYGDLQYITPDTNNKRLYAIN